uniref:uncharacterized protein LOC120822482 n=1 Tax=Gasterosteus aculeatus aculeatus TaxID=481459 RepID=UPI001A99D742|nr:uncharacterized protein LOC120822482 [Gasterosteus aculeatus aculeatus]
MAMRCPYIWILNGISLMLTSGALAGTLLQNVALKQQAVQSSNILATSNTAGRAVDGLKDVRYEKGSCTCTQEESDPWWRVDLRNLYNITAITITQEDTKDSYLIGGEIWIGNSTDEFNTRRVRCAVIPDVPGDLTFHFSFRAIEGRYVTVRLPGSGRTLCLCEFEVFIGDNEYPQPNLALKGDATQSSTSSIFVAAKAIDGSRNSYLSKGFCTHTESETDPWWRVDLRQEYVIAAVKVTNRGDCCGERLDGAEIRVGSSLENNGNNNTRCASIPSLRAGKTKTYHCEGGSKRRPLRERDHPRGHPDAHLYELWNLAYGTYGVSSHAVSGCKSGMYMESCCSVTIYTTNPSWTVDLLAVHRVSAIMILNIRDCCTEGVVGAEIWIDNSRCGTILSTQGLLSFTFNCAGMTGRYIKVYIPKYTYLSLCEVEVFASLAVPEDNAPSNVTAPPPPPAVSVLLSGRNVTVVGERLCWSDALLFCRRHHWDLLILRSQEEQSELERLLGSVPFPLTDLAWLGLRRYLMGDVWFWMSGDAMPFTKWPRGTAPWRHSDPCGGIGTGEPFEWESQPCDELLNFIRPIRCRVGSRKGVLCKHQRGQQS